MPDDALESAVAGLLRSANSMPDVRHRSTVSAGATRSTHIVDVDGAAAVVQLRHRGSELQMMPSTSEAAVVTAADAAGVPVAAPIAYGWIDELAADAIVSRWVAGETLPRRILRRVADGTPPGDALAADLGRSLARLHTIPADATAHIEALPHHDERSYLDHLHHLLDELPTAHPALRYGLAVLADTPLPPHAGALVHGDFRNGNLLVDEHGLAAVLDWELAHVGNPMEDAAWLCLRTWRFGHDDRPVGGFATIEPFRAAYEAEGGTWDEAAFRWWTIARTIWWGAGLATQAAAFMRNESDSLVHAASGRRVVELEYDLLNLIGDHDGS